mmetsp:Transcript_2698/g.8090  ORF Transcript_2698/g.8090 Transcript_2698/m.8090 type:complete len:224 (-) Transcript_2698:38-709(-)
MSSLSFAFNSECPSASMLACTHPQMSVIWRGSILFSIAPDSHRCRYCLVSGHGRFGRIATSLGCTSTAIDTGPSSGAESNTGCGISFCLPGMPGACELSPLRWPNVKGPIDDPMGPPSPVGGRMEPGAPPNETIMGSMLPMGPALPMGRGKPDPIGPWKPDPIGPGKPDPIGPGKPDPIGPGKSEHGPRTYDPGGVGETSNILGCHPHGSCLLWTNDKEPEPK